MKFAVIFTLFLKYTIAESGQNNKNKIESIVNSVEINNKEIDNKDTGNKEIENKEIENKNTENKENKEKIPNIEINKKEVNIEINKKEVNIENPNIIFENSPKTPFQKPNKILVENKFQATLFYEAILNLDAILFLYTTKGNDIFFDKIFKNVIVPFQEVLIEMNSKYLNLNSEIEKNKEMDEMSRKESKLKNYNDFKQELDITLRILDNFSKNISTNNKKLTNLLRYRNKILEIDTSLQSKDFYKSFYKSFIREYSSFLEKEDFNESFYGFFDIKNLPFKNMKYQEVLKNLQKSVNESDNLVKVMKRELREFLNWFQEIKTLDVKSFNQIRAIINLGGNVFLPSMFLNVSKNLNIPNKHEFLLKTVNKIFAPLLELQTYTENLSNSEKKESIIEFLNNCLKRSNSRYEHLIDDAMVSRSETLQAYFVRKNFGIDDMKIKIIDNEQEKVMENYVNFLREVDKDRFNNFLIINNRIKDLYVKVLCDGNKEDREILMGIFG